MGTGESPFRTAIFLVFAEFENQLYKSTELIAYKIYQTAFTSMDLGEGQAQAIVLFVIVAIISLLQVYFTRKGRVDA